MNTVIFVYKKEHNMQFLNIDDALARKIKLKNQGWEHISTVDAEILLSNINDICQQGCSSDEKIKSIVRLLQAS